jgi:hypothetical protein
MFNPSLTVQNKNWAASKINELLAKQGGSPINPDQITESKLRRDTLLANQPAYTNITFNRNAATSTNASEKLLNINDAFLVTAIRLSVKKLTATATDALHVKAREYTYPNTFVFDGTTEVVDIFGLWNGTISIYQNQKVQFPTLWTGDLLFAPETVFGDTTGVITGPTFSRRISDSKPTPNFGFYGIQPLLLMGSDNSYINLSTGAAMNIVEAAENNWFTITLGGYLVSGS